MNGIDERHLGRCDGRCRRRARDPELKGELLWMRDWESLEALRAAVAA